MIGDELVGSVAWLVVGARAAVADRVLGCHVPRYAAYPAVQAAGRLVRCCGPFPSARCCSASSPFQPSGRRCACPRPEGSVLCAVGGRKPALSGIEAAVATDGRKGA